jgi:cytochrome c oxidase assembly factor CtaG
MTLVTSIISLLRPARITNCAWLCAFAILVLVSVQSSILALTEKNLANHMVVEHTLFFFLGAASVKTAEIVLRIFVSSKNRRDEYITTMTRSERQIRNDLKISIIKVWSRILRRIFSVNSSYGVLWLLVPVILLALWHLPSLFDYALLHEELHILQHLSFIIVGVTGYLALRTLGESFKIIILITLNAIMGFAGLLFSVTTDPLYSTYSVSSHNEAGTYMLVTCMLLLLIGLPAYLIHRTLFHIHIKIKDTNESKSRASSE